MAEEVREGRIEGGELKLGRPLAYRGKEGCMSMECTRMFTAGSGPVNSVCYGWHCANCDEPCSSQGDFGRCEDADLR